MLLEVVAAAAVGLFLLWLVLEPLVRPYRPETPVYEPPELEETAKGRALTALKEIEFDRETGKLSDGDYNALKAKYTGEALDAIRAETPAVPAAAPADVEALIAARVRALRGGPASGSAAPACATCGPRPEPDAIFCSTCGGRLSVPGACARCGSHLAPDSRFCEACGTQVAA